MENKSKAFTIEQIHEASQKVNSGADFPRYVQDLKAIGVTHYDNFVSNGLTKYYGAQGFCVEGESKNQVLNINEKASVAGLKQAITIHQQGLTDYPAFCQQAADAGVDKWTTQMINMTVTYFDKQGHEMLIEPIPAPLI